MLSFEELMKVNEKYMRIFFDIDIKEIAEAFRADEELVRKCFRNGHYSRGILAAALCEKLNRKDPTLEVFGDYYYDVNYEERGEKISLEKKNKESQELLEECSFYDLKLDEGHYEESLDGKNIFAKVCIRDMSNVIKVDFHVPRWF
jgi:hypothetical protein